MIALLLAAQLSAEIVRAPPADRAALPQTPGAAGQLPMPNVYKQPAYCKDVPYQVVDRYGRPVAQKLGDLPTGALMFAVDRSINGCRVITVISGTVLPDQPGTTQGQMMPLIKAPAVREGAPANRR